MISASASQRLLWAVVPPAIILAVIVVCWQGAVALFNVPRWLLPAPTDIVERFFRTQNLWYHTGLTVWEAVLGFGISACLGIAVAAGIVHSRFLESGIFPFIVVSNAIPIVAVVPLLTIWFGFGLLPKVLICAIISFFPIVTNATRGFESADRRVLEFMRSINARPHQVFFKVQLPGALPFIFAGFKIAASLALVGAVVAEFYSSDRGLGYLVITSATELRTDLLFVAVAVLAGLGVASFVIFGKLERLALRGESADMP